MNTSAFSRNTTLDARGATFRGLAACLHDYLKHPVTISPSLTAGTYDFHLKWQTIDPTSLFAALKEQLGLELVEETSNQEYLVVDRVERPVVPMAHHNL